MKLLDFMRGSKVCSLVLENPYVMPPLALLENTLLPPALPDDSRGETALEA